ncbi:Glycosyl Hydrolase Family 88 [Salegentibacter echinorum]|uniref:Glycosyl Hydrolase Family 88 n=1 Tax=Salegentibacter echinorum TaxID=1073325 RepID=A0A1M5HGB2_SALEC|nr:glycoside hydrolase family 88 protein [Salegentibacter echinorum]SHG14862.1 Glycosyl Hydrolase Family 88 [Salegentibacter echinorum]
MTKIRVSCLAFILGFTMLSLSCKSRDESKKETKEDDISSLLEKRYQKFLEYPIDSTAFPRSYNQATKEIKQVSSKDWTSGFYAGNLWQLYQLTGKDEFKEKAQKWNAFIEKEKFNDGTHDMGFKVYGSFGKGLESIEDSTYNQIILKSAKTLATRFNKKVGSLRSWDFNRDKWEFPVIIDNMLNLELLFEATKMSGDSSYHKMAETHANTTLKNHFRKDNSTWHVVVYDTISGDVKEKITHQGINDDSSWARGQAWAIYGFTMAYRYTNNERFLKQAEATTKFVLEHSNLPEDGIPYWDFDDPDIPDAPRDVSAATVITSALLELYKVTEKEKYIKYVDKVMNTLKSQEYILSAEVSAPFILKHSTGNYPKDDEIDGPIVYADYYFLETLLRKKALQ